MSNHNSSLFNNSMDSYLPNDIQNASPPINNRTGGDIMPPLPLPLTPTTSLSTHSFHSTVTFELLDKKLWANFNKHTTEMIVTRPGRKMFPHFKVRIQGLEPLSKYNIFFSLKPVNNYRYRFNHGIWSTGEAEEIAESNNRVLHHDSNGATTGAFWMRSEVIFDKVHLTNQTSVQGGRRIALRTMHRYQPRITIETVDSKPQIVGVFEPVETQFIAVTAYANEKIRKLKIDNNPFAKGFRTGARKRSLDSNDDSNVMETASKSYFSSPYYAAAYNPYYMQFSAMQAAHYAAANTVAQNLPTTNHNNSSTFQLPFSFNQTVAPFPSVNYTNFNSAFQTFLPSNSNALVSTMRNHIANFSTSTSDIPSEITKTLGIEETNRLESPKKLIPSEDF